MSAKVFITQESRSSDYSSANEYGEVHFITGFEFSPHENSARNSDILDDLKKTFDVFDFRKDFLCLAGHPITCGLVMCRALKIAEKGGIDKINFLIWDGRNKKYNRYNLDIFNRLSEN